jgi:N-carbamoyl-L-amino-acid hydrolase
MVTNDAKRLEETFRRYSQIGRTDADGLHRLTLTETDREGRDLFVEDLKLLNLDIRIV